MNIIDILTRHYKKIKDYISSNYQPKGSYASSDHNHNSAYLGINAKASSASSADSATKATKDSDGNQINTTYAKKILMNQCAWNSKANEWGNNFISFADSNNARVAYIQPYFNADGTTDLVLGADHGITKCGYANSAGNANSLGGLSHSEYPTVSNMSTSGVGCIALLAFFPSSPSDFSNQAGTTRPGSSLYTVYWHLGTSGSNDGNIYYGGESIVIRKDLPKNGTWKQLNHTSMSYDITAAIAFWVRIS